MNTKSPLAALLAVVLASGPLCAQTPYNRPTQAPIPQYASGSEPVGETVGEPVPEHQYGSRWLTNGSCGSATGGALCNTDGHSPPIGSEFYVNAGWSIPTASPFNKRDVLGRDMSAGLVVTTGVRTLFFNEPTTRAWVVDASISHMDNGQSQDKSYALRVIDFRLDPNTGQQTPTLVQYGTPTNPAVKIRDTGRTYVNLALGRDVYLMGSAEESCRQLRVGWDVGGRYGCLSQEYNVIIHRTDVIGGWFVGLHSEVEIPTKAGIFELGARTEWGYTWSDILQRASDVNEVNVMLTFGWRF